MNLDELFLRLDAASALPPPDALAAVESLALDDGLPNDLRALLTANVPFAASCGASALVTAAYAQNPVHNAVRAHVERSPERRWLSARGPSLAGDAVRVMRPLDQQDLVDALGLLPDGHAITAHFQGDLLVWEPSTGRCVQRIPTGNGMIQRVTVSPSGRHAVVSARRFAPSGHYARVIDLVEARAVTDLDGLDDTPTALAFTRDGARLVVSAANTITVIDTLTWKISHEFTPDAPIGAYRLALLAGDREVLAVGQALVHLDLETGAILGQSPTIGEHDAGLALALSDHDTRALVGAGDGRVYVWNLAKNTWERALKIHSDRITALALTPDGTRALSASWDRTLRLWNPSNGRVEKVFQGHAAWVTELAIEADGGHALSCGHDRTLRRWPLKTPSATGDSVDRHPEAVWWLMASDDGARAVSLTQNDRFSLSSGRHRARVWSADGALQCVLPAMKKEVLASALHPDGALVAIGLSDGRIEVLSTDTGTRLHSLDAHKKGARALCFLPVSKHLVSGGADRCVKLWNLSDGSLLQILSGHSMPVVDARVLARGDRLISCGSQSGSATWKLWDLTQRSSLATFPQGEATVHAHEDWPFALLEGPDGEIRVWENLRATDLRSQPPVTSSSAFNDVKNPYWAGTSQGVARVRELRTGRVVFERSNHGVQGLPLMADPTHVWLSELQGLTVSLWNVERATCVARYPLLTNFAVATGARNGALVLSEGGAVTFLNAL